MQSPSFTFGVDLGSISCDFIAEANAGWNVWGSSVHQRILLRIPQSGLIYVTITALWQLYIPIHHMWRLSITFYMFWFEVEVGTIMCHFRDSNIAWSYHLAPNNDPWFQLRKFQIQPHKCGGNSMVAAPHPPSTANNSCQLPFICLECMCEPFHVGFEPQQLHDVIILHPAMTYDFSWQISNGMVEVW